MSSPIFLIYLLPMIVSIFFSLGIKLKEKTIGIISFSSTILPFIFTLFFIVKLLWDQKLPMEIELFETNIAHHHFNYTIWLDQFSCVLLFLTHVLGLFVIKYSYTYLQLEKGFQRFFATIQLFIFGMYVLSLAGSIDIFFAGWEIVGLSSFLLIAFYRSHNRSLINAWRIFNIYRVCDLGLLIGAVIGQMFFHEATRFSFISQLQPSDLNHIPQSTIIVIGLFMILASVGKSAQFPFYNWPSRAMEGPTTSSAIFYGALSIHAGVFLLLRTYPLWSYQIICVFAVGLIGLITFILSTIQSQVQSNIKGQIAYSITAQIGLMFIAMSLGFIHLVLIHLLLHALYRCFQLLVSPSIVLTSLTTPTISPDIKNGAFFWIPIRLKNTFYLLATTEFNFDNSWRGFHFLGWKKIYHFFKLISHQIKWYFLLSILILLFVFDYHHMPLLCSYISIYLTLTALINNDHAFYSLLNLAFSSAINLLGILLLDHQAWKYISWYFYPWLICSIASLMITYKFRKLDLSYFHAHGTQYPWIANLFFLCLIFLSGLPFSPIFLAEDIILEKVINLSYVHSFSLLLNFMSVGIIFSKNYLKIFMGRPSKNI